MVLWPRNRTQGAPVGKSCCSRAAVPALAPALLGEQTSAQGRSEHPGLCHKLQTTVKGPVGGRKEEKLISFFKSPPQLPSSSWLGNVCHGAALQQSGTFLLSASQRAQEECQDLRPLSHTPTAITWMSRL